MPSPQPSLKGQVDPVASNGKTSDYSGAAALLIKSAYVLVGIGWAVYLYLRATPPAPLARPLLPNQDPEFPMDAFLGLGIHGLGDYLLIGSQLLALAVCAVGYRLIPEAKRRLNPWHPLIFCIPTASFLLSINWG